MSNENYNEVLNVNNLIRENQELNNYSYNLRKNILFKNNSKKNKNSQKRINKYIINQSMKNDFASKDHLSSKEKARIVSLSSNRQIFSSNHSSNIPENYNNQVFENQITERKKISNLNLNQDKNIKNNENINKIINFEDIYLKESINNLRNSNKKKILISSILENEENAEIKYDQFKTNNNINFENTKNPILDSADQNKKIPRLFKTNSNITELNKIHNLKTNNEISFTNNENNFINNQEDRIFFDNYDSIENSKGISDYSKKSINEKIISIINSSGNVDEYEMSENGKYIKIN